MSWIACRKASRRHDGGHFMIHQEDNETVITCAECAFPVPGTTKGRDCRDPSLHLSQEP
jgi:hypothetical protein